MRRHWVIAAAWLAFASAACATEMEDEKRGYWWNKEAAEDKPADPRELGPPPSEEELSKMHPDDFEPLLEKYARYALWKQDDQSVAWYYQMQDHARRRAVTFTNLTEYVMLRNSKLNMNTAYPTNTPGQNARTQARAQEVEQRIVGARDRAALIMLTQAGCSYCQAQRAILTNFKAKYGWSIREIDLREHPEAVTRFGTDTTPTTVMIMKGNPQWMPVAVGVESVAHLEQIVYASLRLADGEVSPQQFTLQEMEDGGALDPKGAAR